MIPATRAPGVCCFFPPASKRGRRESRVARCTRGLACKIVQKSAHEHTGSAEAVRPSLRNGFTAYVALSSAIGLSCHRRLRKLLPANLTPASRRQDHTILPSASQSALVRSAAGGHRIQPRVRDDRDTPLEWGVDGCGYKVICDFGKPEYFFGRGWTGRNSLIGLRKLDFTRKSAGGTREARSLV